MEIRPFQPQDLHAIALQGAQAVLHDLVTKEGYGPALALAGPAYTATHAGEIVACAGTIPQWEDYSRAWALLSRHAGRCMVPLTRGISRWLRFHNTGRIDTAVDCTFEAAIRWAEMMGFEREGIMKKYKDGNSYFLYAQVV